MTNAPENRNANLISMDLISKHLQEVLDQVAIISDELQEMRERENGTN